MIGRDQKRSGGGSEQTLSSQSTGGASAAPLTTGHWPPTTLLGGLGYAAVLCGLLLAATAGCRAKTREVRAAEVPVVPVSHPVQRVVTDYVDFTGRTDAEESVNIIARVTGYLVQTPFTEGSEVKAGDLLFEIDPRPYQAQLDQAQSQVKLNEAQLELAKTTLARYEALERPRPAPSANRHWTSIKAAVVEAKARVDSQKKSLEVYKLNKEFTRSCRRSTAR